MATPPDGFLVTVELQRVQGFLFASSRLRDMVGANVLLGELLSIRLPALAHGATAGLSSECLPQVDSSDPARPENDNPIDNFSKGILAKDGGHFNAQFTSFKLASAFATSALQEITGSMPGLRFHIRINEDDFTTSSPTGQAVVPQIAICEALGGGRATEHSSGGETVSAEVRVRRLAYDRFRQLESSDTIGHLEQQGFGDVCKGLRPPEHFKEMCGSEYLAIIHADGNDIGNKSKIARQPELHSNASLQEWIDYEARGERFFYQTRVAVRKAAVNAIKVAVESKGDSAVESFCGVRPFQFLMMGGDDLLLVCRSSLAIEFLINYARELSLEASSLSIGAGLVIAPSKMPFHRLHSEAERLAGSAKRLFRHYAKPDSRKAVSVVDWTVITGSHAEDAVSSRQHEAVRQFKIGQRIETLSLTPRPVCILEQQAEFTAGAVSLQRLYDAGQQISASIQSAGGLARSQMRHLTSEMALGRHRSLFAWNELDASQRYILREIGVHELWHNAGNDRFVSHFPDIVEISEIGRLRSSS